MPPPILLHKTLLAGEVRQQYEFTLSSQRLLEIWRAAESVFLSHRHHRATCGLQQVDLCQGLSYERLWHLDAKQVQPLGHHQDVDRPQEVGNRGPPRCCIRHHKIGSCSMEGLDVSLPGAAGNDLHIGPEFPTVECEVDIHVVVAGCDHHRRAVIDASLLQHVPPRCIAHHALPWPTDATGLFLDQSPMTALRRECGRRRTPYPPATDDQRLPRIGMFSRKGGVVSLKLLTITDEHQQPGRRQRGRAARHHQATTMPDSHRLHACGPRQVDVCERLATESGRGDRRLGDQEMIEAPHHPGASIAAKHPAGHRFPEHAS